MQNELNFRVERVIGNNVVLVQNLQSGKELIFLGKGIGFSIKPRAFIQSDDPRIEKRFRTDDQQEMTQYQLLMEAVDPKVKEVSEKIIVMIAEDLAVEVSEHSRAALPSHIQFAVFRIKNGMEIANPFLNETRSLFPQEFEVARKAASLIGQTFGLDVPEEEVGFLTYHVFSATQHVPVKQLVKLSTMLTDLVVFIEEEKDIAIPRESMDYIRLINHLRFAVERVKLGKTEKNPFAKSLKKQKEYKEEYGLAVRLARIMEERLGIPVPEDEVGYIVMHLYRLFQHYSPKQS